MKPCKSLAHCRQHGIECDPEGTYLGGRIMLRKVVCKKCGRAWAEIYMDTGLIVDLNASKGVTFIESDFDAMDRLVRNSLLKMLENMNALKVSDRDGREDE